MKKKLSRTFNALIIVFELVGFMMVFNTNHRIPIEFFTEDSNILALVASSIYLTFSLRRMKIPRWLSIFRYITAVCLTLTFLVVLFILAPMYNFNYYYFLLYGSMLFHHFLCPILFVITFVCFDKVKIEKKDIKIGSSLVLVYAALMIVLNLLKIVDGPYPFLKILKQPIYMSFIWAFIIIGLAYGISVMIYRMYKL